MTKMNEKNLSYKGYLGSVEVSVEDNCLHGKILFIQDLVNYEGSDPRELEEAFHGAVDHYLEKCEELGVDPDKTFSGTFNVRVDPDLHKKACFSAAQKGISLNQYICEMLAIATAKAATIVKQTHHHHTLVREIVISGERDHYEEPATPWQQIYDNQQKPAH